VEDVVGYNEGSILNIITYFEAWYKMFKNLNIIGNRISLILNKS
jgi:hypothetical protein